MTGTLQGLLDRESEINSLEKSLLLLLLIFSLLFSKSSVWVVTKGADTLYIGGTIHTLRPQDYPLPKEFDTAYSRCNSLTLEVDLATLESSRVKAALATRLSYTNDSTIDQALTDSVYKKLVTYFAAKGISSQHFAKLRPSMVSLMITQFEMANYNMAKIGVDKFYYNRAIKDSIPVEGLETAMEQVEFIADLGGDTPDDLILNSFEEVAEFKELVESMISSWKSGDSDALARFLVDKVKSRYPQIYQELLLDRNLNWLPRIEKKITDPGATFLLVGAGHLVGSGGLLDLLEKRGYEISYLE